MKYINILIFLLISLSWNTSYGEPTLNGDTLQNVESEYQEETDEVNYSIQERGNQPELKENQMEETKIKSASEDTADEGIVTLVLTVLLVGCK